MNLTKKTILIGKKEYEIGIYSKKITLICYLTLYQIYSCSKFGTGPTITLHPVKYILRQVRGWGWRGDRNRVA